MAYKLFVYPQAQEGVEKASEYYDIVQPDLGIRFLEEVIATYEKIIANPQYYSFVHSSKKSKVRDVNLPSFHM